MHIVIYDIPNRGSSRAGHLGAISLLRVKSFSPLLFAVGDIAVWGACPSGPPTGSAPGAK